MHPYCKHTYATGTISLKIIGKQLPPNWSNHIITFIGMWNLLKFAPARQQNQIGGCNFYDHNSFVDCKSTERISLEVGLRLKNI